MARMPSRTPKRPPRQGAQKPDATRVFRDFLRQLERLDAGARRPAGEGGR